MHVIKRMPTYSLQVYVCDVQIVRSSSTRSVKVNPPPPNSKAVDRAKFYHFLFIDVFFAVSLAVIVCFIFFIFHLFCRLSDYSPSDVSSGESTSTEQSSARWKVFRRYKHFHSLNSKVGDQVPTNFLNQFPSKRWLKSNFSPAFLRSRRTKLEAWLREVAAAASSTTLNPEGKLWVRRFLTAKANTPPFRMTTPIVAANRTLSPTTLTAPTTITLADFHLVRMLGIGAYGRVILVQHRVTSKLYAMKVLSKAAALETKQMVRIFQKN